ncbi:condensation domain-containing protein [Lachnospiraceae bacterium ZAX-1]
MNKEFALTDLQYSYYLARQDKNETVKCCRSYFEFKQMSKAINISKLSDAWSSLFVRHEMMRVQIANGKQEILDKSRFDKISIFDLLNENIEDAYNELEEIRSVISTRLLRIEKGQVMGLSVCLMPDEITYILFDVDMICCDIQSVMYIFHDLSSLYLDEDLPTIPDEWGFENWMHLITNKAEKNASYWDNRCKDMPGGPMLPRENEKPLFQMFENRNFYLSKEQWIKLKNESGNKNIPINVLILMLYSKVIAKWSKNKSFLINVPIFNQPYKDVHVVGDFSNLLLIRVNSQVNNDSELLAELSRQYDDGIAHQPYSGLEILRKINSNSNKIKKAPVVFSFHVEPEIVNEKIYNTIGALNYFINQTPNVWIDFQVYRNRDNYVLTWITQKGNLQSEFVEIAFNEFREELFALIDKAI